MKCSFKKICIFVCKWLDSVPNMVVSYMLKGSGPRNQRAESEASGAERQKGT